MQEVDKYSVVVNGTIALTNAMGLVRLRLLEYLPTHRSPVGLFRVNGVYKLYNLYLGTDVYIPAMIERYCQLLDNLVQEDFGYRVELVTWGSEIETAKEVEHLVLRLGKIPIGMLLSNESDVNWLFNIQLTNGQQLALKRITHQPYSMSV